MCRHSPLLTSLHEFSAQHGRVRSLLGSKVSQVAHHLARQGRHSTERSLPSRPCSMRLRASHATSPAVPCKPGARTTKQQQTKWQHESLVLLWCAGWGRQGDCSVLLDGTVLQLLYPCCPPSFPYCGLVSAKKRTDTHLVKHALYKR